MYIVTATNKYGIDETPVMCDIKEQAETAMKYLMVHGILNQKPEIIDSFCKKYHLDNINGYEDLKTAHYTDRFFKYIEDEYNAKIAPSQMKIYFSNDESDMYETNYWSTDELAYNLGCGD